MLRTDRRSGTNYRSRSIHSMHLRTQMATVNVHEAVAIGTEMIKHYERTWPGGFHDTLPKKVRTMAITKKHGGISKGVRHQSDLFTHHCLESFRSGHEPQRGFEVRVSTYPYYHFH